jgi:uncharacterized membrane-anchored protein
MAKMESTGPEEVLHIFNLVWVMRTKSSSNSRYYYWFQVNGKHEATVERLNNITKKVSAILDWIGLVGLFFIAALSPAAVFAVIGAVVIVIGRLLKRLHFRFFGEERLNVRLVGQPKRDTWINKTRQK